MHTHKLAYTHTHTLTRTLYRYATTRYVIHHPLCSWWGAFYALRGLYVCMCVWWVVLQSALVFLMGEAKATLNITKKKKKLLQGGPQNTHRLRNNKQNNKLQHQTIRERGTREYAQSYANVQTCFVCWGERDISRSNAHHTALSRKYFYMCETGDSWMAFLCVCVCVCMCGCICGFVAVVYMCGGVEGWAHVYLNDRRCQEWILKES